VSPLLKDRGLKNHKSFKVIDHKTEEATIKPLKITAGGSSG